MRLLRDLINRFKKNRDVTRITEGIDLRIDPYDWRPMNVRIEGQDLSPRNRREMYDSSYESWLTDPLAGHVVNLTTWFVMGDGISFTAKDERARDVLSEFWVDDDIRWDVLQAMISDELQVFGEIFLRLFINPVSGRVKASTIDPREIVDISRDSADGSPTGYLRRFTKRTYNSNSGQSLSGGFEFDDEEIEEIIDPSEVIHIALNRMSTASRGVSELYRIIPWLKIYSQWLRDRVSLNRARGSFAYLRKVPGSPSQAKDVFETDSVTGRVKPPRAGSVLVVNEGEDWQVLNPSVGADDAKEDGRALKLMIAAGSGIFEHYFGDPSTGNFATARSMELPMLKKFEARQRLLGGFYQKLLQRVLLEAKNAGRLPMDVSEEVEVEFPPIVKSEIAELTKTLIDQLGAGLISHRRALSLNPLVEDVDGEIERMAEKQNDDNPVAPGGGE